MSYQQIFSIAAEAMGIEKMRLELVANNIAHQHTIQKKDRVAFTPMEIVTYTENNAAAITSIPSEEHIGYSIVPRKTEPVLVYNPKHPDADAHGFVHYPGINAVDEMTTMLRASQSYEANIRIIKMAHQLALQTLTIGTSR